MSNKNKNPLWLKIIFGIIIVIVVVGTLGVFIKNEDEEDNNKKIDNENDSIKGIKPKPDPIIKIQKQLEEVNSKIAELEPKRISIEKTERNIIIGSRIAISIIILIMNGFYLYLFNLESFSLGNQLNFNAVITLAYAFVAFTFYGTPANFVKKLKRKVTSSLRKKKIILLSELKQLYKEKKGIEDTLKSYNNNLLSK